MSLHDPLPGTPLREPDQSGAQPRPTDHAAAMILAIAPLADMHPSEEPAASQNAPLHYLLAHQRYRASAAKVEPLVARLVSASGKLQNGGWQRVVVANSTASFPEGLLVSLDAAAWPDIHQLAQGMVEWHQAKSALNDAWDKVPLDNRGGLQAPTDVLPK